MSKLKLTKTASGTMSTQALVDAVNECPGCRGTGRPPSRMGTMAHLCPYCTVLRDALKFLTEFDDA